MLHVIIGIACLAIILGCVAFIVVPALKQATAVLRQPFDPYAALAEGEQPTDAGSEEHDIEQRPVAGISLEEHWFSDELPAPEEQAHINRQLHG